MSKRCELTDFTFKSHNVSHAKNKTKEDFANLKSLF